MEVSSLLEGTPEQMSCNSRPKNDIGVFSSNYPGLSQCWSNFMKDGGEGGVHGPGTLIKEEVERMEELSQRSLMFHGEAVSDRRQEVYSSHSTVGLLVRGFGANCLRAVFNDVKTCRDFFGDRGGGGEGTWFGVQKIIRYPFETEAPFWTWLYVGNVEPRVTDALLMEAFPGADSATRISESNFLVKFHDLERTVRAFRGADKLTFFALRATVVFFRPSFAPFWALPHWRNAPPPTNTVNPVDFSEGECPTKEESPIKMEGAPMKNLSKPLEPLDGKCLTEEEPSPINAESSQELMSLKPLEDQCPKEESPILSHCRSCSCSGGGARGNNKNYGSFSNGHGFEIKLRKTTPTTDKYKTATRVMNRPLALLDSDNTNPMKKPGKVPFDFGRFWQNPRREKNQINKNCDLGVSKCGIKKQKKKKNGQHF